MEKSWGADKLAAPTLSYWCFIPGMAFRMLKNFKLRRWVRDVHWERTAIMGTARY
jgi:regulator of telomere elongation helicase 1